MSTYQSYVVDLYKSQAGGHKSNRKVQNKLYYDESDYGRGVSYESPAVMTNTSESSVIVMNTSGGSVIVVSMNELCDHHEYE